LARSANELVFLKVRVEPPNGEPEKEDEGDMGGLDGDVLL